jgi:hypothetical protein
MNHRWLWILWHMYEPVEFVWLIWFVMRWFVIDFLSCFFHQFSHIKEFKNLLGLGLNCWMISYRLLLKIKPVKFIMLHAASRDNLNYEDYMVLSHKSLLQLWRNHFQYSQSYVLFRDLEEPEYYWHAMTSIHRLAAHVSISDMYQVILILTLLPAGICF